MKNRLTLILAFALLTLFTSLHIGCEKVDLKSLQGLSNSDIVAGLREALDTAALSSSKTGSAVNGFLKNELIRLALPKELRPVLTVMKNVKRVPFLGEGLYSSISTKVDDFTTSLNRAAEAASGKAFPVFKTAITDMSISDGLGILQGGDTAATHYLREKTTAGLMKAFQPECTKMIEQVEVTKYYKDLAEVYNRAMPLVKPFLTSRATVADLPDKLEVDLPTYVTDRTIHGMFILMRGEEKKIRDNPLGYASDIIKKVFGSDEAKQKK